MVNVNSNILLTIVVIIIIIAIIYYLNKNNSSTFEGYKKVGSKKNSSKKHSGEISDSVMDELLVECGVNDNNTFSPSDPMASPFGSYEPGELFEESDSESDNRNFTHKKKKYKKRTPEDIKDLFDINKMLPNEIEEKWFDVQPLQATKKIKGTHFIHPKIHMGQNTVSSSLKNATHDIRGEIPNPKINVSPWGNSTIEPDKNLRGLCA